jgi:hypothetical protein
VVNCLHQQQIALTAWVIGFCHCGQRYAWNREPKVSAQGYIPMEVTPVERFLA